jgi:putative transcriptional regulator
MRNQGLAFLYTRVAAIALLLACAAGAMAAGIDEPVLLVAKPQLADPLYRSTVLLVKPMPNGGHIGFIINKPTAATLGQFFPEHEASKKIVDPVFLGGPAGINAIFALVERRADQKDGTLQMAPNLFLAIAAEDVDWVIEAEADRARFFAGMVVWRPGELKSEMERGFWYALEPDARLVLRKNTEKLWHELLRRSEELAHML